MNSTTTGTSDGNGPPHITHLLATTIVVWTSVVFNIISCVVIGRKVILKFSRLRFGCFLTSIVVIVQGIVSVQRIWDVVSELSFSLLRSVTLVLFINLMVAITLDLGGKFYVGENRRGALYWATLVATAIINVMFVVAFILLLIPDTLAMGTIIHNASRVSWPVVLLIAYWYAFSPVVKTRLGEKAESQSAVVAVGIWYLTGMGFFLFLHTITIVISIPFSDEYKELKVIVTAVVLFIRSALLDFYSFPPSTAVILVLRRRFSPDSRSIDMQLSWPRRLPESDDAASSRQ